VAHRLLYKAGIYLRVNGSNRCMNRNIRIDGLTSRVRANGTVGSVLTARVGPACVSADMAEENGVIRISGEQTIVRVRLSEDGGISAVAVDDEPVWTGD